MYTNRNLNVQQHSESWCYGKRDVNGMHPPVYAQTTTDYTLSHWNESLEQQKIVAHWKAYRSSRSVALCDSPPGSLYLSPSPVSWTHDFRIHCMCASAHGALNFLHLVSCTQVNQFDHTHMCTVASTFFFRSVLRIFFAALHLSLTHYKRFSRCEFSACMCVSVCIWSLSCACWTFFSWLAMFRFAHSFPQWMNAWMNECAQCMDLVKRHTPSTLSVHRLLMST